MDDVIYRQAAIDAIERAVTKEVARWSIEDLPSAQKKGEWLYDEEREATGIYAICSCCDEKVYQCGEWLFCPRCGADMRGENDG